MQNIQNVLSKTSEYHLLSLTQILLSKVQIYLDFLLLPQYIEKAQFEIRRSIEYGINIGIKNLHFDVVVTFPEKHSLQEKLFI